VGTVSETDLCSGDTRAMGMTFVLSVPAVWMEWLSEKGFDWAECREGLCRGELWDWGSRSMVMLDDE
jgi:hypothetical protein